MATQIALMENNPPAGPVREWCGFCQKDVIKWNHVRVCAGCGGKAHVFKRKACCEQCGRVYEINPQAIKE